MDVFMNERLRYAINMVAMSERHVLPKATPLHRSQRSVVYYVVVLQSLVLYCFCGGFSG